MSFLDETGVATVKADYVRRINAALKSAIKRGPSIAFADLPVASEDVLGIMYNVTDAFKTTSSFVEGEGIGYPANTDVVVVNAGTNTDPVYKYNVMVGDPAAVVQAITAQDLAAILADD